LPIALGNLFWKCRKLVRKLEILLDGNLVCNFEIWFEFVLVLTVVVYTSVGVK